MNRRTLNLIAVAFAVVVWICAIALIAQAEDGREPGDPRQPVLSGAYTGRTMGPSIGANTWNYNGTGIAIGFPRFNDPTAQFTDWQSLHFARLAEVAEAKLENIQFDFDKSEIEQQYETDLDFVSRLLTENPEVSLTLSGHTDAMGSDEYNDALADRRADAVRDALVERGVAADRLTTAGFGKSRLLDPVTSALRANRRVEVEVAIEMPVYLD
jgi:outer membrane protein OmpA-like peptidoglycan-associated protein